VRAVLDCGRDVKGNIAQLARLAGGRSFGFDNAGMDAAGDQPAGLSKLMHADAG
jgi:hypothetical protein